MNNYKELTRKVINEIERTLLEIDTYQIDEYVNEIMDAKRVFFIGVGRVKISLEAAVKRFNHLGIESVMVGSLTEPPITASDLLIVGSGSGESVIPLQITKKAKELGAVIVHITSNPNSSISQMADKIIEIETPNKLSNNVISIQPMSTLFEQVLYILNDVTAMMIMEKKSIDLDDLKYVHANLE